jgi:UDP-N-acetylmuramoyl-L-alanyl-D-glutamate--2,6-diaminopimelate ligase
MRAALPRGPYLVVGLGRAGRAAADALLAAPAAERVLAWDRARTPAVRDAARRLSRRGVEVTLGGDGLSALAQAGSGATLIKSPGVDLDVPLLERARSHGLRVLDELELGWRLSTQPIVGVTGTNGKSTTSRLIAAVLQATGHETQLVGNTEFGAPLSAARAGGWLVCEVSSFQLEAAPSFLPEIAVFTNLTPEHLTRHLTMERYGAAKRAMFVREDGAAKTVVVNGDDPYGRRLAGEAATMGARVLAYGFDADADVRIERVRWSIREAELRLHTPTGPVELSTRLPGEHNARNAAAAFAVGIAVSLPAQEIVAALAAVDPPPGRWELITTAEPFDAIVDYAHTPDGIRQVLRTARAIVERRPNAALRTVFGAVGLHDPAKASASGRIAAELSDHLILTTGSAPRDARVPRLQELIRAAEGRRAEVEVVLERRAAIERAVATAEPGDAVAVLGLGALQRLVLDRAGTIAPHDDREAVRASLARTQEPAWS